MYPIFLRFQGGKGIATAAGVIIALNPWLALATAMTWLIIAVFSLLVARIHCGCGLCAVLLGVWLGL